MEQLTTGLQRRSSHKIQLIFPVHLWDYKVMSTLFCHTLGNSFSSEMKSVMYTHSLSSSLFSLENTQTDVQEYNAIPGAATEAFLTKWE